MSQIFLETRMFWLSDGEEIMTLVFFVFIQYRSVTDKRTDRFDRDIPPLAIPAVCIARYANALVKSSQMVQTLNSAMAGFGECSMGRWSRRPCISTRRWRFSHSCTARFTSFKIFLLHSSACFSNSYSAVFSAAFQQQSTYIICVIFAASENVCVEK